MASELVRHLGGDDVEAIVASCKELASMNLELASIAKLLSHQEPRVKAAAASALQSMEGAEAYAANLAQLVGDSDSYVRIAAAGTLNSLGTKAASQVRVLGKFLGASDPGTVAAAAHALATLGPDAADFAPQLEAALGNGAEDTSTHMLAAAGVLPKTPEVLRKPACAACKALGNLGQSSGKLEELLESKDFELRACAIKALTQMGADSTRFESKLIDLLKDPAPSVASAACAALGALSANGKTSSSTAATVAELLTDPSPMVKASAVESLAQMGDEAEAFLEPLCRLFNDKSWTVRVAAVKALAGCGELGQMYASEVCRLTTSTDAKTRAAAANALGQMGERGACFDEEVELLLSDPDPFVAAEAKKAIQAFLDAKQEALAAPNHLAIETPETPAPAAAAPPAKADATLPVGLLFPGQGSQYVKMLQEVQSMASVKDMLATAQKILGYDVLKLCLEGPEDKLEQTKYCQPAMYIAGLAALELLKSENPKAAANFRAVAGLSLGEYTALTVAGVFDFETGLRLVKLRGEAMQEAAEATPQKMISVAGLSQQVVEKICAECRSGPEDVCQVANFLFPNGFSCAGSASSCDKLLEKATKADGCLQAKALKTSGAFHTKCMLPAKEKLQSALKEVEPKLRPPSCAVYMNVTGDKILPGTPVPQIIEMMSDQLTSCVLWEPAMKAMIRDGITDFYECGPMKQLKAMMKRIDQPAWKTTQNIHV
ncbi:unnamed protein product [Effrenium voratum]|uniref:Malonyl-CoA:ACP transacylase (MAT) domain-containing protein n=1 Tax=Effrenium voratum TaxID=2562239 RepID=A0AA36J0L0_9DINO|nr:unnamed protein product [Effrenium voratum]CAJ1442478.1 unnamed protein product [Effrenium voratum]